MWMHFDRRLLAVLLQIQLLSLLVRKSVAAAILEVKVWEWRPTVCCPNNDCELRACRYDLHFCVGLTRPKQCAYGHKRIPLPPEVPDLTRGCVVGPVIHRVPVCRLGGPEKVAVLELAVRVNESDFTVLYENKLVQLAVGRADRFDWTTGSGARLGIEVIALSATPSPDEDSCGS